MGSTNAVAGPRLSIVTSAHSPTRLKYVGSLLRSIADQRQRGFETIIVVDGSAEVYKQVKELISQIRPPNPNVIFSEVRTGASGSRNLGARAAKGDIVGFVDDDVVLPEDWAATVIQLFQDKPALIGISGLANPLWEDGRDAWLPRSLYWVISCTEWFGDAFRETKNMWTMNAAIRRGALLEAGGFDTQLGPKITRDAGYRSLAEDLELTLRLRGQGHRFYFAPFVKCLHYVQHSQVTFPYIIRRSIWIGKERRHLLRIGNLTHEEPRVVRQFFEEFLSGNTCRESPRSNLAGRVKGNLALVCSLFAVVMGFLGAGATSKSLRLHVDTTKP